MKCADVAKLFIDRTMERSITPHETAEFRIKFKACEDFPKEPEKFETIWDCRPSLPEKLKMPDQEIGKKWRVTFEEIE